jgi:putative SOS response-associated peptidase YedK
MEGDESPDDAPRFNITPGSNILALRLCNAGGRELVNLRWGLIPSWAKDAKVGSKMINARAETLGEKASFRDALRNRRCLIPVDGFYEWKKAGEVRTPYFIRTRDGRPFYLAGLWERWISPTGDAVESCSIITTSANDLLSSIHDRMPVIIRRDHMSAWLDAKDISQLSPMLTPLTSSEIEATAVGTLVNNPRNDNEACLIPERTSVL